MGTYFLSMKKYSLIFIILFFSILSKAQYFQTGQDPAYIKWRQIKTENFQLIYPDYFEKQAQKLAASLEKVYHYGIHTLAHKPKKISVILHTQTVRSNGLVAWAPKRSEFYTTPHQAIYPQPWLEQLAIHEFRHVVQIDKVDSLLPGIIKLLLGQSGTALVFGTMLPWWFIEGDAVVSETALSKYGRGRLPSFLMEHRAQVVEKGIYSYDKAYNGSYKDFIPNHYKLGYYLVGHSRAKYGSSLWDSAVYRVGRKPFSLNPFNKSLKNSIGLSKVGLYTSVFNNLEETWLQADKKYKLFPSKIITRENKFANYTYNHWLNNSSIVSYKESLDEIPQFVKIDLNGNETRILRTGRIFNKSVNYRDNLIVWSEQIPDARWSHSGKSLINVFDIDTKKKSSFYPEHKGLSPSISPDKKKIALIETDFSNRTFLSVYNLESGILEYRLATKYNDYLFSPDWLNENELILIVLTQHGKRLAKANLKKSEFEILFEGELGEIRDLKVVAENVYFISGYTGKNSLYKLSLNSKQIQLIAEPRFGLAYPAVLNNKIALSSYSANGYKLLIINENQQNKVSLRDINATEYKMADKLARQERGVIDFNSIDTSQYHSKKYRKIGHLFHFHSWAPAFVDASAYTITPGVSLMSQNKLGTAETTLGYKWDYTERTGKYFVGLNYKGWYPEFKFEMNTGKSASEYYSVNQITNSRGEIIRQDTTLERFTWNNSSLDALVKVPLNLSRGSFNRLLQSELKYELTSYKADNSTPETFFTGNYQALTYRLYFHQLLKQSKQDLFPDFGIVIDGFFKHSPIGNTDLGQLSLLQSQLFLPGLFPNHGIKIYAGHQKKYIAEKFSFSDIIRYPRGWGKINTKEMFSTTLDYKFPLLYPDWSMAGLAYVKRINMSLFADYAHLKGYVYHEGSITGTFTKSINSFGVELTGDAHFFRFYAPVEMGVRASYIPELNNTYFNFLFSIDFSAL